MNNYLFLKEHGNGEEPDWLAEQLIAVRDSMQVIDNAAVDFHIYEGH